MKTNKFYSERSLCPGSTTVGWCSLIQPLFEHDEAKSMADIYMMHFRTSTECTYGLQLVNRDTDKKSSMTTRASAVYLN